MVCKHFKPLNRKMFVYVILQKATNWSRNPFNFFYNDCFGKFSKEKFNSIQYCPVEFNKQHRTRVLEYGSAKIWCYQLS